MKKNIFYGVSAAALMFAFVSCGGDEETTDETTDSTETTEDVIETMEYTVDTEASIINWYNMEGEEKGHSGTVNILEGTFTTEADLITNASLTMDMNTLTADSDKLAGHLVSPAFFDVNQYASATFTFGGHVDGIVSGTLSCAGQEFAIEAPATVTEGTVEIADFNIDMSVFPYFQEEKEKAPEEEWHDTNIGFTATIVAQ